jgi:hypothetical protein
MYPIESTYYAFEIKSECSASNLRDAIEKTQKIIALEHSNKQFYQANKTPAVSVFFAFGSDLSAEGKNEFTRYKELDSGWKDDPVIRVLCVIGSGYWYFSEQKKHWLHQPSTPTFDEVLILVSHTVNTLMPRTVVSQRPAPLFGDYLRPPCEETEGSAT